MNEVYLVIETIKELMERRCNGSAHLKIGSLVSDPVIFRNIFNHFTNGTEMDPELKIESVPVEVKCECGYRGEVELPRGVRNARCPKCHRTPEIIRGKEFEILEPK